MTLPRARTYDSVGIEYDISRERVCQITRLILKQFALEFIIHDYSIRKLRKDCDRLISKINETNVAE